MDLKLVKEYIENFNDLNFDADIIGSQLRERENEYNCVDYLARPTGNCQMVAAVWLIDIIERGPKERFYAALTRLYDECLTRLLIDVVFSGTSKFLEEFENYFLVDEVYENGTGNEMRLIVMDIKNYMNNHKELLEL